MLDNIKLKLHIKEVFCYVAICLLYNKKWYTAHPNFLPDACGHGHRDSWETAGQSFWFLQIQYLQVATKDSDPGVWARRLRGRAAGRGGDGVLGWAKLKPEKLNRNSSWFRVPDRRGTRWARPLGPAPGFGSCSDSEPPELETRSESRLS